MKTDLPVYWLPLTTNHAQARKHTEVHSLKYLKKIKNTKTLMNNVLKYQITSMQSKNYESVLLLLFILFFCPNIGALNTRMIVLFL